MKSSPVPGKKAKNQDIRDPRDTRVSCFNSACFVTTLEDWKCHSKYAGQITQPWKPALLWNKAHWFLVENIFCLVIIVTIAMLLPKWPNDSPWSTPHCGAKIKYGERRSTKMNYIVCHPISGSSLQRPESQYYPQHIQKDVLEKGPCARPLGSWPVHICVESSWLPPCHPWEFPTTVWISSFVSGYRTHTTCFQNNLEFKRIPRW